MLKRDVLPADGAVPSKEDRELHRAVDPEE